MHLFGSLFLATNFFDLGANGSQVKIFTVQHWCQVVKYSFFSLLLLQECTDSLLNQLDQQLKITEDECKHYRESLEQLGEGDAQEHDQGALENEIEQVCGRVFSELLRNIYWDKCCYVCCR